MAVLPNNNTLGVRFFGRYKVTRMLGQGGMGAVYEAVHTELGKKVAIKALHASFARDENIKARFIREGRLACKLRHPHVVDILDVGEQDNIPFMVMEYLDGEDLDQVIKREGALEITRVMEIVLPVMAAVMVAHEEGIIHRDLKPANVYLAHSRVGDLQPKVLDFGLCKMTASDDGGLTSTSVALGTPDFMSPEQVQNSRTVDARCDQYSLGVLLYECLTGKRPFASETLAENVFKVLSGTYAPPRALRPELPEALEALVVRAMRVEPEDRFASVRELAKALLPFASEDLRRTWEPVFAKLGPRPRYSTPARIPSFTPPSNPSRPSVGSVAGVVDVPYTLEALRAQTYSQPRVLQRETATHGPLRSAKLAPPSGVLLVAAVALGVAMVGGGVFAAMRFLHKSPEPLSPPPARVETFRVVVSVEPATASLQIDASDAGVGHITQDFPRDGRMHMLRATAPGYEPGALAFRDAPPPRTLSLNPVVDASVPPLRERRRRR